jgi:phosphinothricin acetyltransferase
MIIRDARTDDLPAILAIYNDVLLTTTASTTRRSRRSNRGGRWFEERTNRGLPVLVAEIDGAVAGYSSFGEWRARWGYRFTSSTRCTCARTAAGRGAVRALIEALFPRASALGMHVMMGQIDSTSAASIHLHRQLGFEHVRRVPPVGHKFGKWLDLVCMQRMI